MYYVYVLISVVVVVLLVLLGVFVLTKKIFSRGGLDFNFKFSPKPPISEREMGLYRLLLDVGSDFMILPQVGLSRFLDSRFLSERNRIDRMSVDYLVCDWKTRRVVFGIELDDSSHLRLDRIKADRKKDAAFLSAGIPLVRFDKMPSRSDLIKVFDDLR